MAEQGSIPEAPAIPGVLKTNTYILGDFAEIAYIVCAAAIPSNADPSALLTESTTQQQALSRLENAERQFRLASILVVLDRSNSELFTFYKKADIVKDQQTVLRKFGQICQANSCKIAYKNACRIIDLLKPDSTRVYQLFSEAILSSVKLQSLEETAAVKVSAHSYLLPIKVSSIQLDALLPQHQVQWRLHRIDLQVITNGQVVLIVQKAPWPALLLMADMIDPDVAALESGSTLLLVPGGQLCRYRGRWHIQSQQKFTATAINPFDLSYRNFWIEKMANFIKSHAKTQLSLLPDTIWLEVEIPLLRRDLDDTSDLEWKILYWPAALSYAVNLPQPTTPPTKFAAMKDPLMLAQKWFVKEWPVFAEKISVQHEQPYDESTPLIHENFFDEEPQFGSPQQFMSIPMQTFVQSQMVYPTPPDAASMLNTPGVVPDEPVATPNTGQIGLGTYHSSPSIHGNAFTPTTSHDPAIASFLKDNGQDVHDDLFDVAEDGEAGLDDDIHEPNWDFFGVNDLDNTFSQPEKEAEGQRLQDEQVPHSPGNFSEMDYTEMEDVGHFDSVPDGTGFSPLDVEVPDATEAISSTLQSPAADAEEDMPSVVEIDWKLVQSALPALTTSKETFQVNKARRSSAYEVASLRNSDRDRKYAKHGKYWFDDQTPRTLPLVRQQSESSTSSSTSSQAQPAPSSQDELPSATHIWTHYSPKADTIVTPSPVETTEIVIDSDHNVEAVLGLVSTDLEPGTFHFDISQAASPCQSSALDRDLTGYRLLAEQLSQATTLSYVPQLQIPQHDQPLAFELVSDAGGTTRILDVASLHDLTSTQTISTTPVDQHRISSLPPSTLRFRQGDNDIASNSSMMRYWSTLNLDPLHGMKDVLAVCICPSSKEITDNCERFFERLEQTWGSCNLGTHRPASLADVAERGIAQWKDLPDLFQVCRDIATALSSPDEPEEYTIVYMIIPDSDLMVVLELCNAFIELTDQLTQNHGFERNDTVLQLIPASFITEQETISVPNESQFFDLAMEIYNRIPPAMLDPLDPGISTPATILEPPIQGSLHFELNLGASSAMLRYGQCCHVAYCISIDDRWLNATWTNECGSIELTMSFCFYDDGDGRRSRYEIFECICEATTQLMSRQKSNWYLAVAKIGLFDKAESQEWHNLATQMCKDQPHLTRILLLTIEMESRLTTYAHPTAQSKLNVSGPQFLSTPVTTPQPFSTTSPEQSAIPGTPSNTFLSVTNAPTPPETVIDSQQENEVFLSDPQDEVWAVVFGFGFNQGYEAGDLRLSIGSGLLLKHSGQDASKPSTNMIGVGVNLVGLLRKTSEAVLTPQDRMAVLYDVLQQYRGLNTLAVARRTLRPSDACIPWHAATAYKSVRALEAFI